jgi:hypothetical protein
MALTPLQEGGSVSRKFAEEILLGVASPWADNHEYCVGGGGIDKRYNEHFEAYWKVSFGLCASKGGQLIPETDARALSEALKAYCLEKGVNAEGGHGPF